MVGGKVEKKLINQILKFGVVGGIAFVIDYGLMVFLTEVFKVPALISAAISFTVSVIFNYIASVKWVFDVDKEKNSKTKELIVFIILSVIGLGINELIMWIMDKEFGKCEICGKETQLERTYFYLMCRKTHESLAHG